MTGSPATIAATEDAVLTNHRVVRDGSVWLCMFCLATWPYPQPLPVLATDCIPRRWGDT